MTTLRRTYYLLSVLPALLYLAAKLSAASEAGWAAAYAGVALIVPIYASFVLGCAGVGLVLYSRRRGEGLLGPVIATIVAGAVSVWYVGRLILALVARPMLIGLALQ